MLRHDTERPSMSATRVQIQEEVRNTLVGFLREFHYVQHLWAQSSGRHITFWLLTKPVSHDEARELFRANGEIYRNVADADFDLLVINPAAYEEWTPFEPPYGAEEIPLH
jgi:hypothetical protein